jgi:hypothetical protein
MQTSRSLEHDYDAVGARWLAAMLAGDFEAAWRETDRIELPRRAAARAGHSVAHAAHLVWDGSTFAGRRVRVRCNHGLGDTLQFIRFVPGVVAVAREVTVLVQPHLVALLAGDPRFGHVIDGWTDDPPPCDVEIEVMELAYACRATPATLPRPAYLPVARVVARKSSGMNDATRTAVFSPIPSRRARNSPKTASQRAAWLRREWMGAASESG